MPVLVDALRELPSGERGDKVGKTELSRHLRENYLFNDAEKMRQKRMRERLDLYHDRGKRHIDEMIDELFKNETVRRWRKLMEPYSRFQNLTRRVIDEISRVYQDPARRRVAENDEAYNDAVEEVQLGERMRVGNALTNLCNDVFLYAWMARDGAKRLDVLTPDTFWAISHPLDARRLIGIAMETAVHESKWFLVVTEDERFTLTKDGQITEGDYRVVTTGFPGVLVQRRIPTAGLLDADSGADLISAHKAIALINVMMMRAQKASVKTVVGTGMGAAPDGQPLDEEVLIQIPDGSAITHLDLTADPENYIKAGRAVIKQVAANYGIPESVFDLSYNATSGFEITLKRTGLREKRREQLVVFRRAERKLAGVMSRVYGGFTDDGWRIDFGEIETPQDPMQFLLFIEKARQMGLTNTVEALTTLNPDLDAKAALRVMLENIKVEIARNEEMRPLQAIAGSMNAANEPNDDDDEQDEAA